MIMIMFILFWTLFALPAIANPTFAHAVTQTVLFGITETSVYSYVAFLHAPLFQFTAL